MIIVTGSDGIIGRGLCRKLQELSIPFIPLTHGRKSHTLRQAAIVDLANDFDSLSMYRNVATGIVHLAAAVPHKISYPDNEVSANSTRRMDKNVQNFQKQTGVPVIYMSSCGLYDRSTTNIKYEDNSDPIKVSSPYFSAKIDGEVRFLSEGISTILRLAAPVGAGLKPQLVLSRFINIARKDGVINIWGSGRREQDFIDTRDVAELIIRVLKNPQRTIMNAASGLPVTMMNLAESVVRVVGSGSIEMVMRNDPRDGETARYAINKAKDHYNWVPQYSLQKSISELISEDFEANK